MKLYKCPLQGMTCYASQSLLADSEVGFMEVYVAGMIKMIDDYMLVLLPFTPNAKPIFAHMTGVFLQPCKKQREHPSFDELDNILQFKH